MIHRIAVGLGISATLLLVCLPSIGAQDAQRITIIYDSIGASSTLQRDWGFAALVEYGGRRILFDTGSNATIFRRNVEQLGLDLTRLDAAVISHRHGDHTGGLSYLRAVNPNVTIHTPPEETTEIFPGIYLIATRSEKPVTAGMSELSLAVRTPRGLAVVVGCSHTGVEKILGRAAEVESQLYTVVGGFHLGEAPAEEELQRTVEVLKDELKIERVAPCHCTGEPALAAFLDQFEERFDQAGLGSVIILP